MMLRTRLTFAFLLVVLSWLPPTSCWGQLTDTTQVQIHDVGDFFEMENGHLGVRLPKAGLFSPDLPNHVPAPIRSVIYKDGTLSNENSNFLDSPSPALSMSTNVLYQTTDSCAIRVSYTFEKPELLDNQNNSVEPAGPGYYRITFRMVKGEKACMVTEESDFEVGYELPVSNGLLPDRGRYLGHHSTSVADGYDVNGNIYNRLDKTGWQATVDLQFAQRKNYNLLARWNPWIENGGWHWQLYNDAAGPSANTFGIFDGRPSQLLGTASSGAGIYTEPAGVSDLHGACNGNGECHYVWQSLNEIWYQKFEADGSANPAEVIASDMEHPFVFIKGETVNVLAIEPLAPVGQQMKLLKKIGNGSFQTTTLSLDATLDDPFLYGASNGTYDFILLKGTRNGEQGLQLYSANFNSTDFSFADILPNGEAWRRANRPDVKALPNGDVFVAYTEGGFFQSYNLIPNNSTTFSPLPPQPLGSVVTFGMAVDGSTGDLCWIGASGEVHYADFSGITVNGIHSTYNLGVSINHGAMDLPNRRSMATDADGNALVFHESQFLFFDAASQNWSKLNDPAWDGLEPAHIHFNPTAGQFFIVGRQGGRLVRMSYEVGASPNMVAEFPATERQAAGVRVLHNRVTASNAYFPDIRFQWALFAGTKENDLPAADVVQPITRTMNRLSGLAHRLEEFENTPTVFSSDFQNGSIYISEEAMQTLIDRIRADEEFYTQMHTLDPGFKLVMDAWRDDSGAKTNEAFEAIVAYADDVVESLTNGDGIYSFYHLYTTGGNEFRRRGALIAGLLADDKLSAPQRETLEKKAALFARILWDEDFVPFSVNHGLNLGTANMPPQFRGYRWFYALLLTPDPEFSARANAIPSKLKQEFAANLNGAGAPKGTPHYLQPALENLIFPALQLKNEGISDEFADNDTLRLFADFVLHLQTPPSVRFSNHRKLVCFGDGTEESAAIFGLLATGFADVDEALSQRLMYAYRNGPARATDFGFVTTALNHELLDSDRLKYGSAHFPGYLSTFRTATGTDSETATWFINGDYYFDHRNDDRGALAIYALGAPLALASGSFYSPYTQGGHMKNSMVRASHFPEWNSQTDQPYQLPVRESWSESEHLDFMAFEHSALSTAFFSKDDFGWKRSVYQFSPRGASPMIVIRDSLTNTNQFWIWNMNLMSDGPVVAPSGTYSPPERKYDYQFGPYENPVSTSEIGLPGLGFHKYEFTGQEWPAHPTNGIDWELYVAANSEQSSTLTEWAHTFIPVIEAQEFEETNGVPFEERYQMLRLIGNVGFFVTIVPFGKGDRPPGMVVTRSVDTLTIQADDFEFQTGLTYSTFKDAEHTVLTTYGGQYLEYEGASVVGGATELDIFENVIYARVHGLTGLRQVQLPPGNWELSRPSDDASFNANSGKWELNFIKTSNLSNSFTGNYAEFIFTKKVRVNPKIILEGSYEDGTGLMHDNLRNLQLLPTLEPYTDLGYAQILGGDETISQAILDVQGENAIVDWVFLELRDKSDSTLVVSTRSVLLQRDGDVVDIDGNSPVEFYGMLEDDYYLAIRHRNHMGVMTAEPVSLAQNTISLDFTDGSVTVWGTDSQKDLGNGQLALYAGDVIEFRKVDAGDRMSAWNHRNPSKYDISDANLDGKTDSADKILAWANRNVIVPLP